MTDTCNKGPRYTGPAARPAAQAATMRDDPLRRTAGIGCSPDEQHEYDVRIGGVIQTPPGMDIENL